MRLRRKADKGEATTPTNGSKKKKKLIIIALAAVLLLGGGAGGYFFVFAGSGTEAPAEPEEGIVVSLEPVTINLADGHYLKIALGLQATADASEEPDGSKALDIAIDYFGDLKMTQLSSSAGRRKAKKELAEKVEKAYHGEVMDIYFREFVMQ